MTVTNAHSHHVPVPTFVLLPQMSGNGYYSYSPIERQFGTRDTVDMAVEIARAWFDDKQYLIGIGDMSYVHGGPMHPHKSHNKGTSVDVRPLRKDRASAPANIVDDQYDHAATSELIAAFMAHKNVKRILFNDPEIPTVHPYPGHNNHFHIETWR